uniref:Uncharacterized protein n=1 Tax=Aplanochytrium stocchinoi TaxID=215587 RepID=A0A7S3PK88_9STRA|mmetsp:Transcript_20362/g.24670  ORF Transcript_20362/g.24670 Transcript_20362/m.24670 type:complete len:146 (+) Transcript_20362:155-592(+)|eukprot:CAMPEP_0204839114 /NCGR_PEP_ID=MMETSP1346-20131115/33157_1 /ASSEMBLY_ACC=CAM_ASM_000771 /TAXON_ID=215587 /ORGANISM="Aplanochytrium stocchinoi, Strain GSBS06" /LENGTH=145 /DNA_ID=CAMNT_0051975617 /DNA_START=65 /DNA_END=502 /DNA_ORIENTATION=+
MAPAQDDDGREDARYILRHAVGVFGFSTWITGMLQAFSITEGIPNKNESQWRTAHVGGTMHAVFLFAIAGALKELNLSASDRKSLAFYSVMMGWGNSLGYSVGALIGKRGLEAKPDGNLPPLALFLSAMYALAKVMQLTYKGTQP